MPRYHREEREKDGSRQRFLVLIFSPLLRTLRDKPQQHGAQPSPAQQHLLGTSHLAHHNLPASLALTVLLTGPLASPHKRGGDGWGDAAPRPAPPTSDLRGCARQTGPGGAGSGCDDHGAARRHDPRPQLPAWCLCWAAPLATLFTTPSHFLFLSGRSSSAHGAAQHSEL